MGSRLPGARVRSACVEKQIRPTPAYSGLVGLGEGCEVDASRTPALPPSERRRGSSSEAPPFPAENSIDADRFVVAAGASDSVRRQGDGDGSPFALAGLADAIGRSILLAGRHPAAAGTTIAPTREQGRRNIEEQTNGPSLNSTRRSWAACSAGPSTCRSAPSRAVFDIYGQGRRGASWPRAWRTALCSRG